MKNDTDTDTGMNIFIGRQPILNLKEDVVAYELLYRSGTEVNACTVDQITASATTMVSTVLDTGLREITHDKLAFVNFTEQFILDGTHLLLPKREIVMEVLETVEPTPEIVAALQEAKRAGYTIALDDFLFKSAFAPLLKLADIVKIDWLEQDIKAIESVVEAVRPFGVRLLAERIETREQFEAAKDMGFELFQGFFFAKPKIIEKKAIAPVHAQLLRLLSAVEKNDITTDELEALIANDVSMTMRLLRYLNSPAVGIRSKVESIRRAITMIGLSEIRKWVRMIVMARMSAEKPSELTMMSVARAHFCEQLATRGEGKSPEAFTAGLLSLVDAILDMPMSKILEQLGLSERLNEALVSRKGELGNLLTIVQEFECCRWQDREAIFSSLGIEPATALRAYWSSIRHASAFLETVGDPMRDAA